MNILFVNEFSGFMLSLYRLKTRLKIRNRMSYDLLLEGLLSEKSSRLKYRKLISKGYKHVAVIAIILGLTACSVKNERYYLSHPQELQKALKVCPTRMSQELNCQQLEQIGNRMNRLAYQLQLNPQAFGNKILILQQVIANQRAELKKSLDKELQVSLAQNEHDLVGYLAVVKWLESPES